VHSRKVDIEGKEVTLEFGHEGVLYQNAFVMYDKRTNSKWVHANGQAMKGSLAGKRLNILPSRTMRWKEWKKIHPNTKVLARQGRGGFMGTFVAEHSASSLGISVGQGPRSTLYPYDELLRRKVINDIVNRRPVLITIDSPQQKNAVAFHRDIDNRTLQFEPVTGSGNEFLMKDQQTGTVWNRLSGKAIRGPLKGKKLQSIMAVPWKISRWQDIYEQGTVYSP